MRIHTLKVLMLFSLSLFSFCCVFKQSTLFCSRS